MSLFWGGPCGLSSPQSGGGDSNLLVIPLLRVISRRGKLRKGQPPRQTPLPPVQGPRPRICPRGRRRPPRPSARSSLLGYLGPPATGGWGSPRAGRESRTIAPRGQHGAEGAPEPGPAVRRTHRAPRRSAPAPAAGSGPGRAPSRAASRTTGQGEPGLRSQLAARWLPRWLLRGSARLRAGRLRAPPPGGPAHRGPAPHEAPPRGAHSAASRHARAPGRRAHGGVGVTSNARDSPRCDRGAHARGRVCSQALQSPVPTVRPWGAPPAPCPRRGAEQSPQPVPPQCWESLMPAQADPGRGVRGWG